MYAISLTQLTVSRGSLYPASLT
uniref:Uncharacterized protein n=1 Tax=Anguilla anguilla TaxID=7936 RepID=A0A0E9UBE9_ANGAN